MVVFAFSIFGYSCFHVGIIRDMQKCCHSHVSVMGMPRVYQQSLWYRTMSFDAHNVVYICGMPCANLRIVSVYNWILHNA